MANYCTLQELKQALRITDNIDDALLNSSIDAASRFIDGYCQRSFPVASGTSIRDYTPSARYEPLYIDVATVLRNDIDFQKEPLRPTRDGLEFPYYRLLPVEDGYWPTWMQRATVRVEATYGWESVPNSVNTACILQSSRIFTRFDSPLGIAGFGDMGAMRVSRFVDPDVELLLTPFRKLRF